MPTMKQRLFRLTEGMLLMAWLLMSNMISFDAGYRFGLLLILFTVWGVSGPE